VTRENGPVPPRSEVRNGAVCTTNGRSCVCGFLRFSAAAILTRGKSWSGSWSRQPQLKQAVAGLDAINHPGVLVKGPARSPNYSSGLPTAQRTAP
jgi:hypothetical protein